MTACRVVCITLDDTLQHGSKVCHSSTANLCTKILDFRGFGSSRILILRGGALMSKRNSPESLSQRILVGINLGRKIWRTAPRAEAVADLCRRSGRGAPRRRPPPGPREDRRNLEYDVYEQQQIRRTFLFLPPPPSSSLLLLLLRSSFLSKFVKLYVAKHLQGWCLQCFYCLHIIGIPSLDLHKRPIRLVVRACRGRDNADSTPGCVILLR